MLLSIFQITDTLILIFDGSRNTFNTLITAIIMSQICEIRGQVISFYLLNVIPLKTQ